MGEKVAVIGGTGFLGSHVVRALLQAGHTPVVVARWPDKIRQVLPGVDVEARRGDLTDYDSLRSALQGCTVVQCVAALVGQLFIAPNPDMRDMTLRTNVEGAQNALRAALDIGARRFVLTSSSSTRYRADGKPADEDSPPCPEHLAKDVYVLSKLQEEAAAVDFMRKTGLEVLNILPGGLLGPGDTWPSVVGDAIVNFLNGGAIASIEGGFPLVDVRDVARAQVLAMDQGAPGAAYLVVATTVSSHDYNGLLARLSGQPGPRIYMPQAIIMPMAFLAEMAALRNNTRPVFTRNQARHVIQAQQYDCSRVQRELGLTFTPIEVAFRDAIAWFVENGAVKDPARRTAIAAHLASMGVTAPKL